MRRSRLALLAIPLVAAGAGLTGSVAGATPSQSGVEHIYLGATCANCANLSFIATGVVTDYGHTTTPGVDLKKGKWVVNTSKLVQTLVSQNTTDCYFTFREKGPAIITGGTGAYKGITGKIKVTLTFTGIGAKLASGACDQSENALDVATIAYGTGTGTIKL